jgi:hypothetical protein
MRFGVDHMGSASFSLSRLLCALVCGVVFVASAHAQYNIFEQKPREKPKTAPRTTPNVRKAVVASNGTLVVLSDVPNARVTVGGKSVGTTNAEGELQHEMAANRSYDVVVSAGDEYEPYVERVRLAPRGVATVQAELKFKYGLLELGPILPNAKILVDGRPAARVTRDDAKGLFTVDGIAPGEHTIVYEAPGYVPIEGKLAVVAGSTYTLVRAPQPARVTLTITTEPDARIYVDDVQKGRVSAGGRFTVDDVAPGAHVVKVVKDGYDEFTARREFAVGSPVTLDAKLVPTPASELLEDFGVGVGAWNPPAMGCAAANGALAVSGATSPCLPRGYSYRDFDMSFYVTLTEGRGAAWVARAATADDYYLFYLSGPRGRFPNRFTTYIVRGGRLDLAAPVRSVALATRIVGDGKYTIALKARGGSFTTTITPEDVRLTPEDAGKVIPLDSWRDPPETFTYGAIGFRTVGDERFAVDTVNVTPAKE